MLGSSNRAPPKTLEAARVLPAFGCDGDLYIYLHASVRSCAKAPNSTSISFCKCRDRYLPA